MFKKLNPNYTYLTLILAFGLFLGYSFHPLIHAQPAPTQQNQQTQENQQPAQQEKQEAQEKTQNQGTQQPAQSAVTTIWSLFQAGGPFMWPLLLASIIGLAISLERIFYFAFHKFTKKTYEQDILDRLSDSLESALEYVEQNRKYLISKIISEGIDVSEKDPDKFIKGVEREALTYFAQAERGLPILAAISTIAPLIGFLGTVSGMIGAFDAIANADTVNAKIVAAGIKEALITTATGLIIAVPTMAMFQYFQNKVNTFSAEIETVANHIYKELLRLKGRKETENKIAIN
ncbi:MAG: MotA/TolQ/ExbB proton channel family protein [Leptospiraceae bacterium]|nr:MotA/TolQ/ExbB proton channel family protein [Leptospiraceae bacterium]MDW7977137.1 MotA/TolQ/ExbB proton channel family protein [Leptospiraceae bacterium]